MNVGFDMNNNNADKNKFSLDGGVTWQDSGFDGSIMIRPIFSTELDAELGIKTKNPFLKMILCSSKPGHKSSFY